MNFEQSINYCQSKESYLVEIDNACKELFIENSVPTGSNLYWIGLKDVVGNDNLDEHIWLKSNRSLTEVGYDKFSSTNPDHFYQQCVILRNKPPFQWYDRECEDLYKPICEKGKIP